MTSDRLREILAALHWSQRGLAAILGYDERQVRRWAVGAPIPEPVAAWLERLGAVAQDAPSRPARR
jgi:hypothetical protein